MATKASASRIALGDAGLTAAGAVFDQRRTRTAWFEGQHVTADQFNRDQSYHVTRQADLGRAVGRGVVEGFEVTPAADSETAVIVAAGLGLAASGEAIALPGEARIDMAEIPLQRRLEAMLAPSMARPAAPPEARTGLFVLAASTVEYPSNPIASYPVSATASRTLEDSVINEAVLFTLTPFPVPGTNTASGEWRASAAHRIFAERGEPDLPPGSLPLAMLALMGNRVLWVDGPMVRRHCAPAAGDAFGLGLTDRARAVAHAEQFDGVIGPVIAGNPAAALPAASLVRALPPMGRLPVGSVALRAGPGEPERLSQNWLPAAVPCELVALPADEVEALLRESIDLPPIDLGAPDAVLANTPVSIIVAVPRADWAATPAEVQEAALPLVPPPAVGGAPTDPAAILDALMNGTPAPTAGDTMLTAAWRTLLGRAGFLWYARRRQFQRSDDPVAGVLVTLPAATPPEPEPEPEPGALPAPEVDALAETVAAPLVPLFERYDARDLFDGVSALAGPERLSALTRLSALRALGSDTAVLAQAVALTADEAPAVSPGDPRTGPRGTVTGPAGGATTGTGTGRGTGTGGRPLPTDFRGTGRTIDPVTGREIVSRDGSAGSLTLAGRAAALRERALAVLRAEPVADAAVLAWAAAEPLMIATDTQMRLTVPPDTDAAPAIRVAVEVGAAGEREAEALLARGAGLTLPVPDLAEPGRLEEALRLILEAGAEVRFETQPADGDATRKARLRLARSGAVFEVAGVLAKADAEGRAKLLPSLRKVVAEIDDPATLGEALRAAVGRVR